MADFTAGNVLTAAQLDTAFNTFTINDETGTTYTLAASDAGEMVSIANNSGGTVTIPLNATVAFETGTHVAVLNAGTAGTYTVAIAGGGTLNGSDTSIAPGEVMTVIKTATNTWRTLPFSSSASAPVVDEGASTNVTFSTLTNPDGDGKNYRLARWLVDGTLVVTTAGEVDCLAVGGGSGRGTNNYVSGGGGSAARGKVTLAAGTHTVLVGVRGGTAQPGTLSKIGTLQASGGHAIPSATTGYGNSTYQGHANGDGGGAGGPASSGVAGIGVTDSITGAAVEYGKGGQSITATAPVANTGAGCNGQAVGTQGADGIVYARWQI